MSKFQLPESIDRLLIVCPDTLDARDAVYETLVRDRNQRWSLHACGESENIDQHIINRIAENDPDIKGFILRGVDAISQSCINRCLIEFEVRSNIVMLVNTLALTESAWYERVATHVAHVDSGFNLLSLNVFCRTPSQVIEAFSEKKQQPVCPECGGRKVLDFGFYKRDCMRCVG